MLILIATLLGCQEYTTVEEACPGDVPHMEDVDDAFAVDFAVRSACYRKMTGLSAPALDANVQEAAAAHAAYLQAHGTDGAWNLESENEAFTGEDIFDRLSAAGYEYETESHGVWEMLAPIATGGTAEETVDALMADAAFHEVILQFGWVGGGFAQLTNPTLDADGQPLGPYVYGVIVYDFPAADNRSWVTWPVDGQQDAPTVSGSGGPAFSIVVGDAEAEGSYDSANPYDLGFVRRVSLTGPDGAVSMLWTEPGDGDGGLPRYSIQGYSVTPLAPDTEYTLSGEIAYAGTQQDIDVTFTTSADGTADPATRLAAPGVRMRHHVPGARR